MQTVKPGPRQLFCKPDEAETKTKSGFILSNDAAEKPRTAKVINRGDSVQHYAQGDKVIYKPYSITEIKLGTDEYFLVSEEDILGTIIDV